MKDIKLPIKYWKKAVNIGTYRKQRFKYFYELFCLFYSRDIIIKVNY